MKIPENKQEIADWFFSIPAKVPLQMAFQAGARAVLDLVLPPACRLCSEPVVSGEDFCRPCELALTMTADRMRTACPRCGLPTPPVSGPAHHCGLDSLENAGDPQAACMHCRNRNPSYDAVVALWAYQDRVCDAVVAAKYAHNTALADALGRRLGQSVEMAMPDDRPDMITYVPSHVTRQISRGGIGSRTIAEAVAGVLERPCRPLLRMNRRVAKQAWLDDKDRIKNVDGAFSLRKSYAFPRAPGVANRHILVVDDVLTTGATVEQVANTLKASAARRISVAIVARAVRGQGTA